MGYPGSKVCYDILCINWRNLSVFKARGSKLCIGSMPKALLVWLKKGKEYGAAPSEIHPISEFTEQTIMYYRSLQPQERQAVWQFGSLHCPSRTIPKASEEWSGLRKGGPFGFFVLILAASWIHTLAKDPKECAILEAFLSDLSWTMDQLIEVATDSGAKGDGKGKENKKRKNACKEGPEAGAKKRKVLGSAN